MNIILSRIQAGAEKHGPPIIHAEKAQNASDVEVLQDIPYCGKDGASLMADMYRHNRQDALSEPLPTILMVHGGGLIMGGRKVNRIFCEKLAQKGFLVFSLEYRTLDKANACGEISDVCAGFDFAWDALERYGGDSSRVYVIGESAGAFLSLYAAALSRSEMLPEALGCPKPRLKITALICLSGMLYTAGANLISMVYKKDLYGKRRGETAFMERMNPEHPEVVKALPPVLLTSSCGDFMRKHTLRYAKALKRAGHPCKLLYYPDGKQLGHAFPSLKPSLPESGEVMEKMIDWFQVLP